MSLLEFHLLLVIIAANAAPILATHIGRRIPGQAVDNGLRLRDGNPLFGASKTWRGLFSALILSMLVGAALRLDTSLALGMGVAAMLGDLGSSFIKRRLGREPSSRAILLDQIPESLLPALLAAYWLGLEPASVLWLVFLFIIFELALSPIAYRLRLRKRPF